MKYKSKKSYLFILPWSLEFVGGVNQVVRNLIHQMKQDSRYNPILMVNSWEDITLRKKNINGYDHNFFQLRNPWNSNRPLINFIAFCGNTILYSRQILDFIKKNKIAVINFHYCSLSALNISVLKILRLFQGKLILSFHGKDILAANRAKGIERLLWKIMMHSADEIVTCSESLKDDLIRFHESSHKKIWRIPNGIDISQIEKTRDKNYQLDPALKVKQFVLNIGTYEYIKGQDVLLKAFKSISNDFKDLHLVLIGRPGNALKNLKSLIVSLGLTHRVWLFENLPHSKISVFLEKATVFVLPSRYETFGIVILEAGVYNVPVIASNVGGIREIITHDKTGKLCEPEKVECLTSELIYLLNRPDERMRLGKNIRQHVLSNYSWKKAYQKYIDCIKL